MIQKNQELSAHKHIFERIITKLEQSSIVRQSIHSDGPRAHSFQMDANEMRVPDIDCGGHRLTHRALIN